MKCKMPVTAKLPGSIIDNHGYWYWYVKLPGETTRHMRPLKMPGSEHAMSSTHDIARARESAMRQWEDVTRTAKRCPGGITVEELAARYTKFAETYYRRRDGSPTGRDNVVKLGVRLFRQMYGRKYVADLQHSDMLAHRDALVRTGIARTTVNTYLNCTRNMIEWALDEGLIRALVKAELTQVKPFKPFRSPCPEKPPVTSVSDEVIRRTIECMMPNTADMVMVHRLTGMRPMEMCDLEWQYIDTSCEPWVYRPPRNKNEFHNQPRIVCIGPKAREILSRHRDTPIPFSPKIATLEYFAVKREKAVCPSKRDRRNPLAVRVPRDKWGRHEYNQSITDACKRAEQPHWTPNQLRHTFATAIRRKFGIEAARAVLGHSNSCRITDRYSFEAAEDEYIRLATPAVESLG